MNSNLLEAISHDMTDIAKTLEERGLQVLAWFGLGQKVEIEQEGIKLVENPKEEFSGKVLKGIEKKAQDPSEEIDDDKAKNPK